MDIFRAIQRKISYITRSIAFFPTIVALLYILLFLVLLYINQYEWLYDVNEWLSFLTPESLSSPESLLSTLIGGMISLMVLSFSMVMVVLSQAMNNYSPKLITGIVSEKSHQFVLGNFLGVLLFYILVLSTLAADSYSILAVIIALSILMAMWSIILFIYFIHIVSTSIKINEICKDIFVVTKQGIDALTIESTDQLPLATNITNHPTELTSPESGYLHDLGPNTIKDKWKEHQYLVEINHPLGTYVNANEVLGKLYSNSLSKEEIDQFVNSIIFNQEESLNDNVIFGFTQLMEVAIKALSPGINDPGTAHICLNYLTDLFSELMDKKQKKYSYQGNVFWPTLDFTNLLQLAILPIILYGKSDVGILLHIKKALTLWIDRASLYPIFQNTCKETIQMVNTFLGDIPIYQLTLFDKSTN